MSSTGEVEPPAATTAAAEEVDVLLSRGPAPRSSAGGKPVDEERGTAGDRRGPGETENTAGRRRRRAAEDAAACLRPAAAGAMLACGVADLVVGALAIHFGSSQSYRLCDVPLAGWAVTYGAVLLCAGVAGLVAGSASFVSRVSGYALYVASLVLGAVAFCALVWGSVLAFSADRWRRIVAVDSARDALDIAPRPCEIELYQPVAASIIVAWVLVGAAGCSLATCRVFNPLPRALQASRRKCASLRPPTSRASSLAGSRCGRGHGRQRGRRAPTAALAGALGPRGSTTRMRSEHGPLVCFATASTSGKGLARD